MGKLINLEEFKKRVFENVGSDYTVLKYNPGKYNKSIILHNVCKKEFLIQNQQIYKSKVNNNIAKCPICFNNHKLYNIERVQLIVNEKLGSEYKVLKYISKRKPIEIYHERCQNYIKLYLGNILKGQKCQKCDSGFLKLSKERKHTFKSFRKVLLEKTQNQIDLVEFNGYQNKSKFKCLKCNKVFENIPTNIIRGTRCPFCRASSGEQMIIQLLDKYKIIYNFQYPVKIENIYYFFDFYLPEYNTFIEYDGKQHYKKAFSKDNLENTQKRDKIKNNYCEKNNIKLIRIPYNKFNNTLDILTKNNIISSTTIENSLNNEVSRVDLNN